jgi:hypothetical protein
MHRRLRPSGWPVIVLFLLIALSAMLFALLTVDLAHLAFANIGLLRRYGLMAVMDGGLWQTAEVVAKGIAALALYLLFKGCEREIIRRWDGPD